VADNSKLVYSYLHKAKRKQMEPGSLIKKKKQNQNKQKKPKKFVFHIFCIFISLGNMNKSTYFDICIAVP